MNIAKILRGCPSGTRLYSPIYGELSLVCVRSHYELYPICCRVLKSGDTVSYTEDGKCNKTDAEPTLFPSKEQRDWNNFRLPVKRGDIMMQADGTIPFIATGKLHNKILPKYICGINSLGKFQLDLFGGGWTSGFYIPASEEAKKKLFDKMEEAGFRWNTDILELEKIEPKFKEGDVLINNNTTNPNTLFLFTGVIINNMLQVYCLRANGTFMDCGISISSLKLASVTDRNKLFNAIIENGYKYDKEQHKLIKQEFKPFDKVLVRNNICESWKCSFFSHYQTLYGVPYLFVTTSESYKYCIPYKDNECLLGKTINPYII